MRIVYMLTCLFTGGAESLVVNLAHRMQARGHAVRLVVLREPPCHIPTGALAVRYLYLQKNPLSFLRAFASSYRSIHDFAPHLIHSHNFHGNMLARLQGKLLGIPVVSTIHNVYEGGWQRTFAYRLTDRLSNRSIAVSQAVADHYLGMHAIAPQRCGVIGNGIDVRLFSPSCLRRSQMRIEMGVRSGFVWICAGRITPAKDYRNLLHAFARVRGCGGQAELWVAGDGASVYAREMQSLARNLHVHSSVRWLGIRHDLPALLDAADGFVLASAWEGMPLALAEAMAMEKPVVATGVGGVRELIGEAGRVVPAQNAAALADAMLSTMYMSAEQRASIGGAARTRICAHFDIEQTADAWERIYFSVAGLEAGSKGEKADYAESGPIRI